MTELADFVQLRQAVREVCREANKGIFNNLEGVLLRLVDAVEGRSAERKALVTITRQVDSYLARARAELPQGEPLWLIETALGHIRDVATTAGPDAYADWVRAGNAWLISLGGTGIERRAD